MASTGSLILTLAGGLIGTIIAPGVGTSIGLTIGGIVGSMAFPTDPILTEGPRLGDLSVTASTPGISRPIGYGAMRISGNIIWALDIEEVALEEEFGGGFFGLMPPTAAHTTYTYFGNFAVAFGEGPAVDVFRIWANNKIIFDKTEKQQKEKGLNFRFHDGGDTQTADSLIVEDKGVSRTPAFRNTVYIVFDNMLLTNYGNVLPQIQAEIVYNRTRDLITEQADLLDGGMEAFSGTDFAYNIDTEMFWGYDATTTGEEGLRLSDMNILKETRQRGEFSVLNSANEYSDPLHPDTGLSFTTGIYLMPDGGAFMQMNVTGSGNSKPVISLGSNAKERFRFPTEWNNGLKFSTRGEIESVPASSYTIGTVATHPIYGPQYFAVLVNPFGDSVSVLGYPGMEYKWDSEQDPNVDLLPRGLFVRPKGITKSPVAPLDLQAEGSTAQSVYITVGYSVSGQSTFVIHRITPGWGAAHVSDGAGGNSFFGVTTATTLFSASAFFGDGTLTEFGDGLVYDRQDGNLIFQIVRPNSDTHWVKVDFNGNVIWKSDVVLLGQQGNPQWGESILEDGILGYVTNDNAWLIDTTNGDILFEDIAIEWPETNGFSMGVWNSRNGTYTGLSTTPTAQPTIWFLERYTKGPESVGTIVKDICVRSDLALADLDTTDIDPVLIPGYMISRQMSGRNAILPLQHFYFFDGVESDFQLKFILRGNSSVRTVDQNELALITEGDRNEYIKESRKQEVELPERFSTTFLNTDNDYLQETQSAKRILNPAPAMYSHNQAKLEIAASLSPDVVKQQAEKALFTAWEERKGFEYILSWEHLDLDPTDVITLTLESATIQSRISQFDIIEGFAIEVNSIAEATNQFLSTSTAYSGEGTPIQTVRQTIGVQAFLLDTPLLDDNDEPILRDTMFHYWYAGGLVAGSFVRGVLFKSVDGLDYDLVSINTRGMTWGTVINAIGDPGDNDVFGLDTVNTITIAVVEGESNFQSISELQMLNGTNVVIVVKENGELEVIYFQTVTVNADGTLTLSILVRGRRGTDTMAFNHTVGEFFVLAKTGDAKFFTLDLAELDLLRFYKALGQNEFFSQSQVLELTSEGRALMPYAPVHEAFTVGGGNDITITWVRRTRINGDERDLTDFVPLNEDSELYDLEILSGAGGAVVRTFSGIASPTQLYTSAQQVTDGFLPPLTSLCIKVYQVSGQVGRGFTREACLGQTLPFGMSPADPITVGEAASIQMSVELYDVEDAVTISEVVAITIPLAIDVEDAVTLTELVNIITPIKIIEDITVGEFVDIDLVP